MKQREDKDEKMQSVTYSMKSSHLEEETFSSIEIDQMTQVILIPIFGICIALALCLGEFLSYRAKLKFNKKNKLSQ